MALIRINATEHSIQSALFAWAALACRQYPELEWMYAIPNAGKRSVRAAAWMRMEGLKAGVLDLHLPVARGSHIGLYIEHKTGKNKPTELQLKWIDGLRSLGHRCEVSYSFDQSRKIIVEYMES